MSNSKVLQLIPAPGLTRLAFDAATVEAYMFLFKPLTAGPAVVTIDWYRDQYRTRVGHCVWGTHVIDIPNEHDLDIPPSGKFTHGWMPEFPVVQFDGRSGNHGPWFFPQLIEPDHPGGDRTVLNVGFNAENSPVVLIVYRDSVDPTDTANGDGVITRMRVECQQS